MEGAPLLKENYVPETLTFPVKKPYIASGEVYYFKSGSGLKYQVTFGRKKNNYLANIVNFSVLSDDFEDEYSVTNKGEVWKIINTMIEIIAAFHENHPYSSSYEFSGEFKENESKEGISIRTRLYFRSIEKIIDLRYWDIVKEKNKIILRRR